MIHQAGMRPVNAYESGGQPFLLFGIGTVLGIDFLKTKWAPTYSDFYLKRFKNNSGFTFTIYLSIGQGELGITPLQWQM